ncbi:MAG TPA: redoxin family protein [Pyrinomonadaceae bacterium]
MNRLRLAPGRRRARRLPPVRIGRGAGFLAVLMLLPAAGIFEMRGPIARAQGSDLSYEEQVEKGRDLQRRRKYEEALKSFKRANEMREKKSAECFLGMAMAYLGLEAYKNVIQSAESVIELAGTDNQLRAQAYNLEGLAFQGQSEGKDQKKLLQAEAALRQGTAMVADLPMLHYNLGFVLMQQNRDPDGIAEMTKYLELQPKGGSVEAARRMIANPRRAREAYAPDFSFTTSDGEYIALEDLHGKVVVLDFWGTWCGPCVESVPSLRNLHKKYSKDPAFVLIGISSDDQEEKWRAFTAENKMLWHQYRDGEHQVQRAFSVNKFPTYMVIDHEGIVRYRSSGAGPDREASLADAVRKQLKIVEKTAPAN